MGSDGLQTLQLLSNCPYLEVSILTHSEQLLLGSEGAARHSEVMGVIDHVQGLQGGQAPDDESATGAA